MKTIKINGMSCHHCVMAVTRALEEIDGIKDIRVSVEKGEATFDEEKPVDIKIIREKIKKAGYELGE